MTTDPKHNSLTIKQLLQPKASKEELQILECVSHPLLPSLEKLFFFSLEESSYVDFNLVIWITLQELSQCFLLLRFGLAVLCAGSFDASQDSSCALVNSIFSFLPLFTLICCPPFFFLTRKRCSPSSLCKASSSSYPPDIPFIEFRDYSLYWLSFLSSVS